MLVLQQHGTHRDHGRITPLVDPHEAQATPRRSEERTTSQVTTCLCAITNTSFELKITMLAALQEDAAYRDGLRFSPLFDLHGDRMKPRRAPPPFLIDKKVRRRITFFCPYPNFAVLN